MNLLLAYILWPHLYSSWIISATDRTVFAESRDSVSDRLLLNGLVIWTPLSASGLGVLIRRADMGVKLTVHLHDMIIISCRSCVNKGYMKDDYVHHFVRRTTKRAPIINRGSQCLCISFNLILWISSMWNSSNLLLFSNDFAKATMPDGLSLGSLCSSSSVLGMALVIRGGNRYYLLAQALTPHSSSCRSVSNSIFHGHHFPFPNLCSFTFPPVSFMPF
jgi:hypothetical protein